MRKIIGLLLLIGFSVVGYAQSYQPISSYGYQWKRGKFDIALLLPQGSGSTLPSDSLRDGAIRYNPSTSSMQIWVSGAWGNISAGGSIRALDSARLSNDTLYFRYKTGGELAVKLNDIRTASHGLTKTGNDIALGGTYGDDGNDITILGKNYSGLYLQGTSGTNYSTDLATTQLRLFGAAIQMEAVDRTNGNLSQHSFSTSGITTNSTKPISFLSFNGGSNNKLSLSPDSVNIYGGIVKFSGPLQAYNLKNNPAGDSLLSTDSSGRIKQRVLDVYTKSQSDSRYVLSSSPLNIYNVDGQLTGNRIMDGGEVFKLQFRGLDSLLVNSGKQSIKFNAYKNNTTRDSVLATDLSGNLVQVATASGTDGVQKNSNNTFGLGGNIVSDSAVININSKVLRFNNPGPAYMEFKRTGNPATIKNAVASFGMHGNPEANVCFNMLYKDAVHRLYEKSMGAMWLALGSNISALQYAYAIDTTADVWAIAGAPYAWWINTAKGYAQMAINNNISHVSFDANLMIDRTSSQASISGYSDLVLAGHRTKGIAGDVYINPYDTGRTYLGNGGGKIYMGGLGVSPVGDAILTVARSGTQPSISGGTTLILEGAYLKGAPGQVYLNAYNTGQVYISAGGGGLNVGDIQAATEKLSVKGNIETRTAFLYTNNSSSGYIAFKDANGFSMGSVGRSSSQNRHMYMTNTIGTKTMFINMPDTASALRALSYVTMTLDSLRNVGIGDTVPSARLSVSGTVKLNIPSASKWDIYYRDSTTGFLTPLAAGTIGQTLTAGNGGKPQWSTPATGSTPTLDQVITAGATTTQNITIGNASAKHLIGNSTAPTAIVGANVTGTISVTGTDLAGIITLVVTSTSSLPTNAEFFQLNFNTAFGSAPTVVYSMANATASLLVGTYVKLPTTSSFQVATAGSLIMNAGTYIFNYIAVQ
jgi:hypothetical protein